LISLPPGLPNYREQREIIQDELANLVEAHIDLSPVLPS
jgi:adenosylcobyric acid synthase